MRGSISVCPNPLLSIPFLRKKAYPELAPDPLSKLTLLTITTIVTSGLDEKPSFIEDISYHETRKPFVISGKISEDSFECLNFSPLYTKVTYVPN